MNIVEVTGGKAKERELVEATVNWCIKKMMPRMRTLDIEVTLRNIDSAYGYCLEGSTNREFELDIRKGLSLFDLVSTVCHEMVHVKQYARGELGHRSDGSQKWKAKPNLPRETHYMATPWEKEAYEKEAGLAIECFTEVTFSL